MTHNIITCVLCNSNNNIRIHKMFQLYRHKEGMPLCNKCYRTIIRRIKLIQEIGDIKQYILNDFIQSMDPSNIID